MKLQGQDGSGKLHLASFYWNKGEEYGAGWELPDDLVSDTLELRVGMIGTYVTIMITAPSGTKGRLTINACQMYKGIDVGTWGGMPGWMT